MKARSWRPQSLFQYLDLTCRAYVDFAGQAWLIYNKSFSMRSVIHPNLCWDEPLLGLWLQSMMPARPNSGNRFDSGHLIRKVGQNQNPRVGAGQVVQPCLLCWDYNTRGACSRKACRFRHECSVCGGQHPSSSCFWARTQTTRNLEVARNQTCLLYTSPSPRD